MGLVNYKHSADDFYKKFADEYNNYNVDFFSCYENNNENCVNCETTFETTFLNTLSKITISPNWNFMDCGCGLGFPMYLASSRFSKVYGVELLRELASKASNNLSEMGVKNFEIINSDIRSVDQSVLKQINVFYLFNPFTGCIFEEFINNLIHAISSSLKKDDVWLIYVNATCEHIIKKYSNVFPLVFSIEDFRKINFYKFKW